MSLTRVPTEILIGQDLEFEKDFADYPADEWTVTYYFRGAGPGFDIAGTPDSIAGTTHVFTITDTQTAAMVAGRYRYQAIAVKGSEKAFVDEGRVLAKVSLAAINVATTYDDRSTAKKIIDAIDALMSGKAAIDQQEYMIGSAGSQRMLKRIPIPELLELRKYYARIARRENGQGKDFRTILAQFDPA
jgi:hypothetical protein